MTGTWYVNGDQNASSGLQARNENGDSSRLTIESNGDVLDWEGGLQGNVSRNRIDWANRSYWSR